VAGEGPQCKNDTDNYVNYVKCNAIIQIFDFVDAAFKISEYTVNGS
jgi:hypothetical protein